MAARTIQLVLHYDGSRFSGWQRQPGTRTVQGELERVLERLFGEPTKALGAGRTDAGVHARGQAVGVRVPEKWDPRSLRRAMNALLAEDLWVKAAYEMRPEFHARYSAISRRYCYYVGTDDEAHSPFRRSQEWAVTRPLDRSALDECAGAICGDHVFRAFAVQGTAPEHDEHRCTIQQAAWRERAGGLVFEIEANRFLHHMVRFLVGTMVDEASGKRTPGTLRRLLTAGDNQEVSAPAPAHALFLDRVSYPAALYLDDPA